ncbi:MAG TPA: amidohydrolase, partial [Phycisphaerales bacterium]|nr:amidohydrolase [Phycisphaerales bacterium]
MNRRQFLFGSAVLAVGCHVIARSKRPEGGWSIVDTHQHLWDLSKFRLPWLKPGGELTRNFTMADYRKATKELGIAKSVYMEVAVAPDQ